MWRNSWHVSLCGALLSSCSRKYYHIFTSEDVAGMFHYVGLWMVLVHENFTTLFTCGKMAGMFSFMGRYIVLAHEDFTTLFTGEDVAGTFDSSPSSTFPPLDKFSSST